MDLFSDLPEPESVSKAVRQEPVAKEIRRKLITKAQNDALFDDLPSPSSTEQEVPPQPIKRPRDDEEQEDAQIKRPTQSVITLRGFVAERKGEREDMQDAHVIQDAYHADIPQLHGSICRLAYYAVFDGHNGSRASRHAAQQLHRQLATRFPKGDMSHVEKEIKRTIMESFKKTDEDFLKRAASYKPSWKDGTTAVLVVAIDNTLYIANLGDSKAILCRYHEESQKHIAIPLSKDHSPTDYGERMRIQKAGGFVKDGRVLGVLEVSRSIGDGQYKRCGVSCLPDVMRCQLTPADRFLVLACDGLWKVFTSDQVLASVLATLQDETIAAEGDKKRTLELRYEAACSKLANEAVRKLSGDNVTVVIVHIDQGRQ
ncbi:integrin-linked kinase-associated serine/threonine phosphatase 2C [Rhipicephalus microplus]|uniref:Integrin-linked kinase-associated serine/threonine phosphatase 2C n=1 Tax=Rhipicephalus microplus TaxID=6941 RepID=A0A6M2D6N9_RHIMP|nr:integrin-linked kinase-associated serine/threonine phosphatase 2C-like [Rhipicephalus microplus]